jgi:hypothetical protein
VADRYLLESSSVDGYLLEDGSGVYLLETPAPFFPENIALHSLPDHQAVLAVTAFAVVNLLTTTLAPVVSTDQVRPPTYQQAKSTQLAYDDTSQGTPLTLLAGGAPASLPPGEQSLLIAPSARFQPADTSSGTPKVLYQDASFAPANMTESIPAIVRLNINADTSRGAPLALLTQQAAAPFVPELQVYIDRVGWQPLDTSRGSFLPLTAKPFSLPLQTYVDRVSWQPLDTNAGTFGGAFPAPQNPFVPEPQSYAQPANWQPVDASRGTFHALFPVQATPFVPNPWAPTPSAQWQPADSSFGVPDTLTAKPFFTYSHQSPQRPADVVDTSRGSDLPLLSFVQAPFAPYIHQAPIQSNFQPADSTRGSDLPIITAQVFAPFKMTDFPAPIESRHLWQPQWTFFGQNPDNIPPAPPPPPPPPDDVKGGATIGDPYVARLLADADSNTAALLRKRALREEEERRKEEELAQEAKKSEPAPVPAKRASPIPKPPPRAVVADTAEQRLQAIEAAAQPQNLVAIAIQVPDAQAQQAAQQAQLEAQAIALGIALDDEDAIEALRIILPLL